jgi:hypothetical protein
MSERPPAILHVFISHFAVGGGLFLVVAETRARREGDEGLLGFGCTSCSPPPS